MGRGLYSQAPSTSTLNNITHLLIHHIVTSGAADQLLRGATWQGTKRGGAGNKRHTMPNRELPQLMTLLQPVAAC